MNIPALYECIQSSELEALTRFSGCESQKFITCENMDEFAWKY